MKVRVLVTQLCPTLCDPMVCQWNSLGKSTGVGCHSLLQGALPTQGSHPALVHCRQTLYHLSYQEAPKFLKYESDKRIILLEVWGRDE